MLCGVLLQFEKFVSSVGRLFSSIFFRVNDDVEGSENAREERACAKTQIFRKVCRNFEFLLMERWYIYFLNRDGSHLAVFNDGEVNVAVFVSPLPTFVIKGQYLQH